MKRILFFYPDNPLINNQGNNARALELLKYFKDENFKVDFVGETQQNFSKEHLPNLVSSKLIDKAYILKKRKHSGLTYLFKHSILGLVKNGTKKFNRIGVGQQREFEEILLKNNYDFIIISYVLFAPFIKNKSLLKGAKTIVDTHDFFTAQFNTEKNKNLGNNLTTEIKYLKKFDTIWTISGEEQFIFSQFLPNKNILTIPHGLENNFNSKEKPTTIDLFYVGSNNPHNTNSAKWFFDKVYPLLPNNIKITVVGRVCEVVPDKDNIEKIIYAQDLAKYYKKTKITICPMLSGTGLKIKVVESLSYGIPVVCNERGVDGLLNKINNGCLSTNQPDIFASYIMELLTNEAFYDSQTKYALDFFSASLDKNIIRSKLNQFFTNKN
jgi:glycosyltransferase involved in cell wall biosynthesis